MQEKRARGLVNLDHPSYEKRKKLIQKLKDYSNFNVCEAIRVRLSFFSLSSADQGKIRKKQ